MQRLPPVLARTTGATFLAVLLSSVLTLLAGDARAAAQSAASGPLDGAGSDAQKRVGYLPGDTLERLAAHATAAVVLLDVETSSGSRQGSGFIVEPDGRIFTNQHVVEGARRIRVELSSGDVYERVKILAVDERRDIAVLEVPGFDLPTLPLGNSGSVRVGTPVIAIGSPLGLENTVSTGIVSARRSEPEGFDLLQISAPTSQGSSGGPVLSESGEAVGIAVSQMGSGQNLNFAVPINYARGLLDHLDGEPLAVLPTEEDPQEESRTAMSSDSVEAEVGLAFDLGSFHGFRREAEGRDAEGRRHRSRVVYRRIEAVSGRPNVERYAETETTEETGPFGTEQVVRRTRNRAIVSAGDLRPISVRGEVGWWTGDDWLETRYDLRFDDLRVTGTVTDSTGTVREIDRELPEGTILRSTRHLAFATLAEDSLIGRSVELRTFDARTGELTSDRYDVRGATSVSVAGEEYRALRVNLASGLANSTAYFRRDLPRVLLRLDAPREALGGETTDLRIFGKDAASIAEGASERGVDGGSGAPESGAPEGGE